jgi:hypothetical protein
MTIARNFGWLLGAVVVLLVAACGGGGGGGGGGDDDATGGIDRGGVTIAQGTINGFGSVIVNGVHYATGSASITVDDQPGTESDLRVGQVVRVEGSVAAGGTTGTARSIRYDDNVEGPVQSIDLAAAHLVVLGQTVQVGSGTSFDDSIVPRSLDGLQVGDRVEVSGLVGSDGVIAATRIELKTGTAPVEVNGAVESVDTAARRLRIGQLQVDYATATLSGFTSGQPANGDLVEAEGAVNGSGVLVATRLERRSASLSGTTEDQADLEGLITRYVSPTDFDVAGQRVTTTGTTSFEGGTAASLALNLAVEVEGGFDATGRIVATEVEFRPQGDVELSGPVDSISLAAGSLVVLGVTVRTTPLTRFEDQSSADVERFDLADLAVGDYVEIRAYDDGSGLVATLLERDDSEAGVELQGIATDVVQPNFRVAGVAITTDAQTEYRDNSGASIPATTFFAVAAGRAVKVRGSMVGDTVLAERAELED